EIIFEGIVHFIVESSVDNEIINKIREYSNKRKYSAFGVMFFDYNKMHMVPYVEVQGFDGVWENSCGSGTTAVGYYLKKYKNIDFVKIIQPGGWLEVSHENNEVFIDGPVEIVAEGISYINL
ncbi:MAG: diaminopimelate epimerase, partial [Cetobacterium sp.]